MREACYRCIGEGFSHVSSIVPFSTWYSNELSQLLRNRLPMFLGQEGAGKVDIIAAVLQVGCMSTCVTCTNHYVMQIFSVCDMIWMGFKGTNVVFQ